MTFFLSKILLAAIILQCGAAYAIKPSSQILATLDLKLFRWSNSSYSFKPNYVSATISKNKELYVQYEMEQFYSKSDNIFSGTIILIFKNKINDIISINTTIIAYDNSHIYDNKFLLKISNSREIASVTGAFFYDKVLNNEQIHNFVAYKNNTLDYTEIEQHQCNINHTKDTNKKPHRLSHSYSYVD